MSTKESDLEMNGGLRRPRLPQQMSPGVWDQKKWDGKLLLQVSLNPIDQ
jgi:hypothetical protein